MKKTTVILGLFLAFGWNAQAQHRDHDHASMSQNPQNHDHAIAMQDADPEFQKQLAQVVDKSSALSEAFVSSDAAKVKTAAKEVKDALTSVDMKLLKGRAHMDWMGYLNTIKGQLDKIAAAKTIEEQRAAFPSYNEALYKSAKAFGIEGETAYYHYCPMANGGKGAYWLSTNKQIKNPYYGDKMLHCGSTKETIR